jgi:8-oxo-dGTP pyrophosphatase MutT (NUDIX family)
VTDTRDVGVWDKKDLARVAELTDALEPSKPHGVGKAAEAKAAGIAVRAANTGRVLMIQRSSADSKDSAAGKWEFPGGKLEDGEHPYDGARREWQEEMGMRLPQGEHVRQWRSGIYHGFVHQVPNEDSVKLNLDPEDRRVLNPDDPDGDDVEVAAWWHPDDMKRSPAIRDELRASRPWTKVTKGDARPAMLHLRVHGVSNAPGGMRVYRMGTRDGHYVGRTLPTRVRARKGDVLKVETGDFLQDVQGDMRWINPNVVSHYSDAPHSWRELSALAGGELAKDGAEGSAGDIPPAGDLGASSSMPSLDTLDATGSGFGPSLSAVHVNVPLPKLSVSYVGERRRRKNEDAEPENDSVLHGEFLPVRKADQWKQLVCGVVLEPNVLDSQDDFMTPKHVEKAAHAYMKRVVRGKASVAKLQHRQAGFKKTQPSLVPVESFIAPQDFSYDGKEMIKAGSWVMVMHCEDDALWQDFLDRKYTGFSIGGSGIRRSVQGADYGPTVPRGLMAQEPSDWQVQPHPDLLGSLLI